MFVESLESLVPKAEKFYRLRKEQIDLDAREAEAKRELDQAAALGGLDDASVSRKIASSNTTLSVIARRRTHVNAAIMPALVALRDAMRRADNAWTAVVNARAEAITAKFYRVNGQFFNGGEAEAKQNLTPNGLPGVEDKASFYWQGDVLLVTATPDTILALLDQFVQLTKKHASKFDLTVPEKL